MNTHVSGAAMTQTGLLAFKPGRDVQPPEFKSFCIAVNKNAKTVSMGIVEALKQQGVQAQAKETTPGNWLVQVGTARGEASANLMAGADITTTITITASSNDIPNTINALNAFFSNWNAVAGLIAVGAAFVAGAWLMMVNRQP
ncbi:hypothetical protein [Pseudomonas mosselii]|uniref:hypothetical protein n=1 Tax=Pseudomonas mosselii TaxID=78327 RepID=UPI0027DABEF0|nr:hypothetical protein [Pseudomonas mosselii]